MCARCGMFFKLDWSFLISINEAFAILASWICCWSRLLCSFTLHTLQARGTLSDRLGYVRGPRNSKTFCLHWRMELFLHWLWGIVKSGLLSEDLFIVNLRYGLIVMRCCWSLVFLCCAVISLAQGGCWHLRYGFRTLLTPPTPPWPSPCMVLDKQIMKWQDLRGWESLRTWGESVNAIVGKMLSLFPVVGKASTNATSYSTYAVSLFGLYPLYILRRWYVAISSKSGLLIGWSCACYIGIPWWQIRFHVA